ARQRSGCRLLKDAAPVHDLGVEPLPHALGVHLAHRHHLSLVGETEDAGGETLPAWFGPHLRRAHEVMARQGEAVDADPAAQSIQDKSREGGPGLLPQARTGPAADAAEEPAWGGADHPRSPGQLLHGEVVAERRPSQASLEKLLHDCDVLRVVADDLEEARRTASTLQDEE